MSAAYLKILAAAYVPALLILSFFPKACDGGTSYALNLLIFFLYSFPFFCVCLEVGMTVGSAADERVRTTTERILHLIRLALAAVILLTLVDLYRWLYLSLILAAAWGILGIVSVVASRKGKGSAESYRKGSIWIGVAVLLAILCVTVAVIQGVNDRKHKVDLVEPPPAVESSKANGLDL